MVSTQRVWEECTTSPTSAASVSLSTKPCRKCTTESRKSSRLRRTPSKEEVWTFSPHCVWPIVCQAGADLADRPPENCYLSCGRISLLVQIYPILFWMEIREKKSFGVLGIFMTFKDYRKKNWFGIIYLLCYYLVVERILNIFLCLTMVILFVFFWSKFLDLFAYFVN